MSATANQPINTNFLSPLGFTFKIKKTPNLNYFVQSVTLPDLSIAPIDVPNPFSKIPFPASSLTYGEMTITFKVDEEFANYLELHEWLVGMGFPKSFDQNRALESKPLGERTFSDISLLIHTSSKNPNIEVVFYDAFPTSLSTLTFDTTPEDVQHVTCTATFKYGRYVIQLLK